VNSSQLKRAKRRVRREVLALRDAIPEAERTSRGDTAVDRLLALPELVAARAVMLFWSFGSEIRTEPAIAELDRRGIAVLLPRVEGSDIVAVPYRPGQDTRTTRFGAREPLGDRVAADAIDVVVVPAVAFDRRCARVGYGAGFYDRFLRDLDAFAVGLGFAAQLVEGDLPASPFDRRLAAVVTEAETIRCST
jgi:5-formyltetrahydrofolate cyclo-ligase